MFILILMWKSIENYFFANGRNLVSVLTSIHLRRFQTKEKLQKIIKTSLKPTFISKNPSSLYIKLKIIVQQPQNYFIIIPKLLFNNPKIHLQKSQKHFAIILDILHSRKINWHVDKSMTNFGVSLHMDWFSL